MKYSFKDVANLLAQDIDRVVRYLLPNAIQAGNEWRIGSLSGEKGDSLGIHRSGNKAGVWCDFDAGVEKGDALELWRQVRRITAKEAITEAKEWLGVKDELHKFSEVGAAKKQNFSRPKSMPNKIENESKVTRYLTVERKLTSDTLSKYQIGEYKFNDRHVIAFPYIRDGEVIMNKSLYLDRKNNKKEMFVTKNSEPCLFGWHMVSSDARSVAIFEGEIDAMTAYQYGVVKVNSKTKAEEPIGMLSVPFGGGSGDKHDWIEYEFDRLALYDEIYVCMDADKEGYLALNNLIARLGRHRCLVVELPFKDANECLEKGVSKIEFQNYFNNARSLDPEELVAFSNYQELVKDRFLNNSFENNGISIDGKSAYGYTLPWDKTWGDLLLRPSELSVWTGTNGHGKSLLLGYLMLNCIKQGARVCIASLEMKPVDLSTRLIRQFTGLQSPSKEYISFAYEWLSSKLFLFNHVGNINGEAMLDVFKYANHRYGVDVFLIDSLMKCGISDEDWAAQKSFVDKLCDFKNDNDCHIHLVTHPRKGMREGEIKDKMDVKGSGGITDLADNVFSVFRIKSKEQELIELLKQNPQDLGEIEKLKQKPDVLVDCSKQRNGEWDGRISLWFDKLSFQYLGGYSQKVSALVDFSVSPFKNNQLREIKTLEEERIVEVF